MWCTTIWRTTTTPSSHWNHQFIIWADTKAISPQHVFAERLAAPIFASHKGSDLFIYYNFLPPIGNLHYGNPNRFRQTRSATCAPEAGVGPQAIVVAGDSPGCPVKHLRVASNITHIVKSLRSLSKEVQQARSRQLQVP